MKVIRFGCDHAGLKLKNALITECKAVFEEQLTAGSLTVEDLGTSTPESCHYPEIAQRFAKSFSGPGAEKEVGVLVCGSGIGIGIAAVKSGLPCSLAYDEFSAREAASAGNVISMGERVVTEEVAKLMLLEFFLAKGFLQQS